MVQASTAEPHHLLLAHVCVAPVAWWRERLLHRPRAHPPDQIQLRTRLVVRARSACPPERLLPDDSASRLVVDVEVARRIAQRVVRFPYCRPIPCEHRTGERVWGG